MDDSALFRFIGGQIRPKLPKVKPTPQKNANSAKSLHSDGIEFKTTLIR
tara:strand:+ start:3151 stop:3297 length:147 start_codon:yes stop_codon:yes gene_type:complete